MSFPVSTADLPSSQAGDTSVEDDGDDVVATIPIKVPLPTIAPTSASETPPTDALMPVLSDVELLAAFVQRRDPAAFTHIVERYGPMVYRVALRAVDHTHSADDVYQATFLVLAQSAHKIRSGEVLPAWLHGTARNIARRLLAHLALERRQLAQLAQQTLAEKGGEMTPSTELDPFEQLTRLNEQQLLDEELQQLPEASRAPLVLFYLEGQTQAEIAQQMGLSVEAVEGRLRRAKQELRLRLVRRGVFLSTVVAAATVLTPSIACAAPASTLVSATLATALGTTAVGTSLLGGTAASTTLTASVPTAAKLAAQEVAAMSAASKATAIFLTTAASTTVATGLLFGAIAGSLWGVPGLAPSVSDSPTVEMASPLNIVREEGEPDPFSLEREQPVLLALVEPDQVPEENRLKTTVYQVGDLNADSLKWVRQFFEANADSVVEHKPTKGLVVRATSESHLKISEMLTALRNQQIPGESEVDFDPVPDAATQEVGETPQDQAKAEFPQPMKTTGLIKTVRKDQTNRPKYVELTLGSNDGLAIGQLLHVDRRDVATGNATLKGSIRVVSVEPDSAVAEVVSSPLKEIIEVGDTVSLQLGDELEPAPELAQLLDNSDVKIVTPESSLRLVLDQSRKLTFPTKITTVDGFASKLLTVTPQAVDTIRVEALAVGETEMEVTCESGKKYIVTVLVNTPIEHALQDELVRQKDAEILKWQQSYRTEQVEKEQIRDELARQSKELNERVSRLNQIVDFQRKQLDELQGQTGGFEVPDGKITTVDAANSTVWLDIGRKDHLRAQVTFSVYGKRKWGSTDAKDVQAKIEVVEVRETSSIARIVEEDRDRPIEVGDVIFSPAWSAGLTESFVIVGQRDLNGDGEMDVKDRQILKDLMVNAGAEIGLEITAEGLRQPPNAKLTAGTKWLIIGDVGDPTTDVNDPEKLRQILAVQKQHELLVQEAREHGIKIVSLKDFLTYMGWKPESRIYIPGGGVPFNLKPGANPPALNELAQAPVALPKSAPITDEMKQFLTEWDAQNQKITTLESSFTRFEFDTVFQKETRSTGTFYLERPDRWRIDFEPADAALLAKPAGRKDAEGRPFKVKTEAASKWICTGKRLYILDVANMTYGLWDLPPQRSGQNQAHAELLHGMVGPLPYLFFTTDQNARQLFSLRFGTFHNPLGDKLGPTAKPLRQAIHVVVNPLDPHIARHCSEADVIFDPDTSLPMNLRVIDPSGNKETVYSFDPSKMKLGVKWELKSPFGEPLLPGWTQTSRGDWPMEFPTMEAIFKGMLAGRPIAPPQLALDPASLARTISITDPETEVELAVHEIRLLQFPIAIAKAEVQYEPVLDVKPVRGQIDTLHIRAINDGRCQLIVTGTNDAVYRVGITAGTPPMNRFRDLDSSEEKAFRALQQHVSLEFPDTSLKEICRLMTAQHNLPFTLDTEDLKAAGADPDLHVSITASGPTLAQALTTMLEKVKEPPLDYYIDSGAVHISTVAAMKDRERLVYYRLACLSPEGQAAAEKYITPLAISVAPLEGDLLVDASVYTHKKFEEFLRGAWRLESQRPAREIPLGLSAPANRSPGAISPVPRTSPLEGSLPKPHSPELPLGLKPGQNPPEAIGGEGQPKSQSEEVFVSLKLFEVDEAGFRQLADEDRTEGTRKLTPKPDFPKLLRALTRENRARLLEELALASHMGRASKSMSGGDFPVPASETEGDKPARQEFGIMTEMTPIKREHDGRLVLKYDLEFSDRNFNNSIQTEGLVVPNVVAKVFRGFSILPVKGTDGILIGPVATISRSENDQPARNVSTYLWMREEVNNPLRLLPGPTNRP